MFYALIVTWQQKQIILNIDNNSFSSESRQHRSAISNSTRKKFMYERIAFCINARCQASRDNHDVMHGQLALLMRRAFNRDFYTVQICINIHLYSPQKKRRITVVCFLLFLLPFVVNKDVQICSKYVMLKSAQYTSLVKGILESKLRRFYGAHCSLYEANTQ